MRTNLFTHSVNPTRHLNVFTLHRIAMLLPVNGGESRRNFFFFQRGVADLSQEKKKGKTRYCLVHQSRVVAHAEKRAIHHRVTTSFIVLEDGTFGVAGWCCVIVGGKSSSPFSCHQSNSERVPVQTRPSQSISLAFSSVFSLLSVAFCFFRLKKTFLKGG